MRRTGPPGPGGLIRLVLAFGFSLVCLVLALRDVSLAGVALVLNRADLGLVALALCTLPLTVAAKALRWRWCFPPGARPSPGKTLTVLASGYLLNILAPIRLGEAARIVLISDPSRGGAAYALGTIGIEKLMELVFMLLSLAFVVPRMTFPDWLLRPTQLALLSVILAVPVFWLAWQEKLLAAGAGSIGGRLRFLPAGWLQGQVLSLAASLQMLRQWPVLAGVLLWSTVAWIAGIATNVLVILALGLPLEWWVALVVMVVTQVGVAAIPAGPGQVGVFHYLAVVSLSLFGVDKEAALGYGILLHLVIYLPLTLMGIAAMWHQRMSWLSLLSQAAAFRNPGKPAASQGDSSRG